MLKEQINQNFIDSADFKYQLASSVGDGVSRALDSLLNCIIDGGKVLLCGNGACGALAQYMACLMVGGLDRERPELPALALGADMATLTAVIRRGDYSDAFASQVRAIGNTGDVLLLISSDGDSINLLKAAKAAHDRDMNLIALTGKGGGELSRMLRDTDVHVDVGETVLSRLYEAHQLILHCLCQGLDSQLLGDE